MRILVGPGSGVHFTHLSQHSCGTLSAIFDQNTDLESLAAASCYRQGVLDLMKELDGGITLGQVCLLDPKAEHELSPSDDFSYFLFGASKILFNPGDLMLNIVIRAS